MDAIEERNSRQGDEMNVKRRGAGVFLGTLTGAALLLGGCVHWPDIATECDAYGVTENHQPMGTVVLVEPLFRDELEIQCAGVKAAVARINPDARISGCVIPQPDGAAKAYYWTGDKCALNHELCHAAHGPGHTERYLSDLERGVPMPYCPENQLFGR